MADLACALQGPCSVEQDEDGAWCACAQLRPGVAAFGDGPTRDAALTGLCEGLVLLLEALNSEVPPAERNRS